LSFAQLTDEEIVYIDSLKKVIASNVHDTLRIDAYIKWDNIIYIYDSELDVTINQTLVELCNEGLSKNGISKSEMIFYYHTKGIANNNLGLVFVQYGDYLKALNHFHESQAIAEKLNDTLKIASAINNIGMIYAHLGESEKALENYKRSLELDGDNFQSRATYLNNMGLCYVALNDHKQALVCYQESLELAKQSEDLMGQANTLCNIGLIHVKNKEDQLALPYFEQGLLLYQEAGNKGGIAFALISIGNIDIEIGNSKNAVKLCLEGLEMAVQAKSVIHQIEGCDCLYAAYKNLGDLNKSLSYHEQFVTLRDSLRNDKKEQEIVQQDFTFAFEQDRLADSLSFASQQETERLKYEASLERKQNFQYVLFAGIGILVLVGGLIFRSYQRKKKDNKIIAQQKHEVEIQKEIVDEKNREITDSINYAKRIQEAILPNQEMFKTHLPESFILYKPKDIVAGDFYWLEKFEDQIIFAVADCTGHGVPGAMVSVVCHNALNRAVKEFGLIEPDKILNKTRELVIGTFEKGDQTSQVKSGDVIRDGMDIALCVLNTKTNELAFAGANNGLYHLHNNEITELIPDKQPIGKYAEERNFTTQKISMLKGDLIYLFSDGYADQFGGPEGKKFKYKQLKELLQKNASLKLNDQLTAVNNAFEKWKGNLEQVDDVCLMGVRI